jgi:hypothetical protein
MRRKKLWPEWSASEKFTPFLFFGMVSYTIATLGAIGAPRLLFLLGPAFTKDLLPPRLSPSQGPAYDKELDVVTSSKNCVSIFSWFP